jgi:hypothetical protein
MGDGGVNVWPDTVPVDVIALVATDLHFASC